MRSFLIDTDTASDDAVAILMALAAPDVRVARADRRRRQCVELAQGGGATRSTPAKSAGVEAPVYLRR